MNSAITSEARPALDTLFAVAGRTAVVTGGSRGIGAMIARGLVLGGAHVVITSRKEEQCRATSEAINAEADAAGTAGRCTSVAGDLSTADGVTGLVDWLVEHLTSIDILVNNAGATWGAPLDEFPLIGWTKVLNTNLVAPFYLITGTLPLLRNAARPDRPARVINIGSVDALATPSWENYSYSASKAGLHMVTRHLAKQLASDGITVNAIAPGPILTDMLGHVAADPQVEAELLDRVPLGRYGQTDDLVGTVRFLASRAGSYLTGTIIPLDGGISGCAG
ncbi:MULTISPECIES: SDR family oxidoreductase [unclassified Rhodococcus (in: high G+C Gram-positive bacteria)]|uniref:SDR family oxidoreductase n=1 Tax=unclassified Rhodococcus (in: high G+C Gram-positive bacteria) TaxID=192944 RepID=UPI00163A55A7|nr:MULTISPECIES: SDR family oxidoreductase [unclassified Rhodococcus (in: high G+C Gram-positive bacteria)]MBC2641907.1 SDR family oxidoreductase [Rhodococcus sp. 3A]MBC2893351.1 SDR family oxidoreductase [Rhodococcus sp. 4CII]